VISLSIGWRDTKQRMKIDKIDIVWMSPEELVPYVKNPKIHSATQIDKIAGQISSFGFDQPIVVDENKIIIKGHGRREASIKLGLKKVPVIISSLDEYQAMAARIADNKVAEAPWDKDFLKFDIGTLSTKDFNLDLTGFDQEEIKSLLDDVNFLPGSENDQGKLDQKKPIECPHCGEKFVA